MPTISKAGVDVSAVLEYANRRRIFDFLFISGRSDEFAQNNNRRFKADERTAG
jgi:hypothetical protein